MARKSKDTEPAVDEDTEPKQRGKSANLRGERVLTNSKGRPNIELFRCKKGETSDACAERGIEEGYSLEKTVYLKPAQTKSGYNHPFGGLVAPGTKTADTEK